MLERFLYFIVNQQSRNSDAVFKKILVELPKYTKNYQILVTENINQLKDSLIQIKKKINEKDLIIIVGGDGSLNQFVTLYVEHNLSNAIGYIPAGSGNDFARTHAISTNPKKAIEQLFEIKEKQELAIICAQRNSEKYYAVNSIGIGIDGLINKLVNSGNRKNKLGPLAYLSVLHTAFTQQQKFLLTLSVDKKIYQFKNVQLALVANNPYFGGGIKIIPGADAKNHGLDVLIADNVSPLNLASIVFKIFTSGNHLTHSKLHYFKSQKVNIAIDSKQYGQKDGEVFYQDEFNYTFETIKIPFWI